MDVGKGPGQPLKGRSGLVAGECVGAVKVSCGVRWPPWV